MVCAFLFFLSDVESFAQTVNSFSNPNLEVRYSIGELLLVKGEMLSNTMFVYNKTEQPIQFYLGMGLPEGFRSFGADKKMYTVAPKDSMYIPVRVVPNFSTQGNTQYMINTFLIDPEVGQIAQVYYIAYTQKISKWELKAGPADRIYFKNKSNKADFSVNVLNLGNEDQDLLMDVTPSSPNVLLQNTNGVAISDPATTFNLNPYQDTTFNYQVEAVAAERNFRRADIDNFKPVSETDERRYSVFVKTSDPKNQGIGNTSFGKKINFVKLGSRRNLSENASSYIPLIVEANANNILGAYPNLAVNLRGNTVLNNGANVVYNGQVNFTNNYFNDKLFNRAFYYLGYFHRKGSVQIGNIGSDGIIGIRTFGRGIKGSYNINNQHRVNGFYLKNPGLFSTSFVTSYGLGYEYTFKSGRRKFSTSYTRFENSIRQINSDLVNVRTGFGFYRRYNINVIATGSHTDYFANTPLSFSRYGYFGRVNFQATYIRNKLSSNSVVGRTSKNFANITASRFYVNNRLRYVLNKKWVANLISNYNTAEPNIILNSQLYENKQFNNQLNFTNTNPIGMIQPFLFYNISSTYNFRFHSRGVGLNYNYIDLPKNIRFSNSIRGGFNRAIDFPTVKDYFIFQCNSYLYVRNVSFRVRYNYGPLSANDQLLLINRGVNAQSIYLSFQHQYVFKNRRLILQTLANYSYLNYYHTNSAGLFPELYYYTNSGWRFRLIASFSLSSRNVTQSGGLYNFNSSYLSENHGPSVNYGFNFGAGIRKEFHIPNPFSKKKTCKVDFVAFYDVNGNGIKDATETTIENVVIRVADWEVLTDEDGKAQMSNVQTGMYPAMIIPLADLQGWFSTVGDSISINADKIHFVPFVRGVKVSGNIVINREKLASDGDIPMDLSSIKISALNGEKLYHTLTNSNGAFEFYLPFGTYTFTMDDKVLGDRFTLLQNNMVLNLEKKIDNVSLSFFIVERQRKVNIKKF